MTIQITHLVRSRRKTIALIVRSDGSLEVRAPQQMSDARIREFVDNHRDWIHKQLARAKAVSNPIPKRFVDGEKFLYLGEEYPLRIVLRQRQALDFDGKEFQLAKSALPKARDVFIRWYKDQARRFLLQRIPIYAFHRGYKYQRLWITSARTRWGSCSTKGNLSFSYRLVMAPLHILDYVIIHELVHLKVKNHSKEYWGLLQMIMPDYKKCIAWLRKNGKFLTIE